MDRSLALPCAPGILSPSLPDKIGRTLVLELQVPQGFELIMPTYLQIGMHSLACLPQPGLWLHAMYSSLL